MEVLAIIPARSGSKRVKNKNIRTLGGKPVIAYTIEAALQSKLITRVVVSTDSAEIASIAAKYGAEVPFLRPKKLSGPYSTEFEYHEHMLNGLAKEYGYKPDIIVNLYPTTPFRKPVTIDRAVQLFQKSKKADSLRSLRPCQEHPHKMWVPTEEKDLVVPLIKKKDSAAHTLSYQLLPKVYIQNASIYITRPETLKKFGNTVGKKVVKFEMDEIESVDINTPLDFEFAEYILTRQLSDSAAQAEAL